MMYCCLSRLRVRQLHFPPDATSNQNRSEILMELATVKQFIECSNVANMCHMYRKGKGGVDSKQNITTNHLHDVAVRVIKCTTVERNFHCLQKCPPLNHILSHFAADYSVFLSKFILLLLFPSTSRSIMFPLS
jgi:hypothetical protein